jgi:hypothetical protein
MLCRCEFHRVEDVRPALRKGFSTRKAAVDAVKVEAKKQGKSFRYDHAKCGSRSIVLGCDDRLKKNATGTCPASVRVTLRKDGNRRVSRKKCNMEHINCNGCPKVTTRILANNNEIQIAVSADESISAKSLQAHVTGVVIDMNVKKMYI